MSADPSSAPSTTWEWRKVKMKPPPAGHGTARAKRGRWYGLAVWPRREPLTIKVGYRGGPESWWLVTARGRSGVFPGHASLEDVMSDVMSEPNYAADPADFKRRRRVGTRVLPD